MGKFERRKGEKWVRKIKKRVFRFLERSLESKWFLGLLCLLWKYERKKERNFEKGFRNGEKINECLSKVGI